MKKIWIVVFVLASVLGLVGCDPGVNELDRNELLRNTVKIELVQYENANPTLLHINRSEQPVFDFNNVTFLAVLDDSQFENVVNDIAQTPLLLFGTVLNEPMGKTMILHQRDGSMIVFSGCVYSGPFGGKRYHGACVAFDENGQFIEYLGDCSHDYVDTLEAKYFNSDP